MNYYRSRRIVNFAIVPYQLNVIQHFLDVLISVGGELFLDGSQIDGVLDDKRIVGQSQSYI